MIVDTLKYSSDQALINIYGFVIMPNHLHLIWEQNKKYGKETAQGSFLKFTAQGFLKKLKANEDSKKYEVDSANKKHEIWQRDSLSIKIFTREVAREKLNYLHFNPVSKKWMLSKDD